MILKGFKLKRFVRENLKHKLCYCNIIGSEDTLMHIAERPSNYFFNSFTYNQAEQIKKGVICVHFFRNKLY